MLKNDRYTFDPKLLLASSEVLSETKEALFNDYFKTQQVSERISEKLTTSSLQTESSKDTFLVDGKGFYDQEAQIITLLKTFGEDLGTRNQAAMNFSVNSSFATIQRMTK